MPRHTAVTLSPAPMDEHKLVVRVPGVQGGAPVLRGTRTPVRSVVALYRSYNGDVTAMRGALPHLSEMQLLAALDYYAQHRAEIDADQRRQEEAFAKLRAASCQV